MRSVKILRLGESLDYKHELLLPEYLACWDVWDYWERARFDHMEKKLTKKDTLLDIGTEHGWVAAIYSKFVGNICLFEPVEEMWGSIKAIWEANKLKEPRATCCALVGNEVKNMPIIYEGWGLEANRPAMTDKCGYEYIHEHKHKAQITIDKFIEQTGIKPTAITIDVEGAEILTLKGARKLLKENDIKVWVSIHPDLAERDYATKPGGVKRYMQRLGYTATHLATDHEEHWYFEKKKGKNAKR